TEAPVCPAISAQERTSRSSVRADTNSSTPSRASASTALRPMPALPPLTIALRPLIPRSMLSPASGAHAAVHARRQGTVPPSLLDAIGARNLLRCPVANPFALLTGFQPGEHLGTIAIELRRDGPRRRPAPLHT